MARENRVREIEQVVTAHRQLEGGGFVVRRPFPGEIDSVDPFLLIDEMGPVDYAPGEAIGAPDHPHRGFETVTYVLEGEMEHEDSAGHRGKLGPGDVQWMTAGGGVVHSEMPSRRIREQGGRVHGFQVWVNLPRRDKLIRPRYQEYSREKLPQANTGDGKAQVRVIAGEALGAHAVIETRTPIVFQDWTLQPGADVTIPFTPDLRMLVYVFEGSVRIGPNGTTLEEGQLAILGTGDSVRLVGAARPGRILLLGGVPLHEPVARYGPFVMNTRAELVQAFEDYESGRMGEITRSAEIQGDANRGGRALDPG
ncbi:MAG: pirin family protein [Deltaproteobacteria bacterium]|jgi:redox-sensitive bicupin YhaK (pirin superfamily)|nr:MAG: pirin family protein [Deltaproteobacteria bacterium]